MSATGKTRYYLIFIFSLCALLTACDKGPFAPDVKAQSMARDHYTATLASHLSSDSAFEIKTLSSSIRVKALYYAPEVESLAQSRFAGDPVFSKETKKWHGVRKPGKTDIIIIMGLYKPDLEENDVVKLGRLRPRLKLSENKILLPDSMKRFGRDSVFIRDYFPVFDPWEEVYFVRFSTSLPQNALSGVEFMLLWPDGVQSMAIHQ